MLRATDSHALVLLALLAPVLGCGDDASQGSGGGGAGNPTSTASSSGFGDEEVCLPRAELWPNAQTGAGGGAGTATSSATVASVAATTAGSGGGAGAGGGGGGDPFPPGCPEAGSVETRLRVEIEVNGMLDIDEPTQSGDTCCYVLHDTNPATGRPLWGEGLQVLPDVTAAQCGAIPGGVERALEDHWTLVARLEHASIASFARLTLDLLTVGAPHDLVAASQRASLDEVRHTELALDLASRFGGRQVHLGAMPALTSVALDGCVDRIVEETVRDGCVNETFASFEAAEQAAHCELGDVRSVLLTIAEDEARHAALAFRIVVWALREGLVTAAFVSDATGRALGHLRAKSRLEETTRAHSGVGLLTAETQGRLADDVASRVEVLMTTVLREAETGRRSSGRSETSASVAPPA